MNRTLKDATVKRYHYDNHKQLRTHLQLFLDAYNHARRLKTLRGLTPYEHVLQVWTKEPERFRLDPSHHIPGPYSSGARHLLTAEAAGHRWSGLWIGRRGRTWWSFSARRLLVRGHLAGLHLSDQPGTLIRALS